MQGNSQSEWVRREEKGILTLLLGSSLICCRSFSSFLKVSISLFFDLKAAKKVNLKWMFYFSTKNIGFYHFLSRRTWLIKRRISLESISFAFSQSFIYLNQGASLAGCTRTIKSAFSVGPTVSLSRKRLRGKRRKLLRAKYVYSREKRKKSPERTKIIILFLREGRAKEWKMLNRIR